MIRDGTEKNEPIVENTHKIQDMPIIKKTYIFVSMLVIINLKTLKNLSHIYSDHNTGHQLRIYVKRVSHI
jgi:hypothetical protein